MKLLRRIVFALVATNLLLLLWSIVRPADNEQVAVYAPGAAETLVHISEISALDRVVLTGALLSDDSAGRSESSHSTCLVRGPFPGEDAARAAMSGVDISFGVGAVRRPLDGPPLYRAMISPSDNIGQAQLRLAEVRSAIDRIGAGIDTYLVTSGPIANAISLGLFSEQSNALNVQRLLVEQGVEVVIEQELRMETQYWVVTKNAEAIDIVDESSQQRVFGVASEELSENLCEMIAQAG